MATQHEVNAGVAALQAYVARILAAEGKSWETWFIPAYAYTTGATGIIQAADLSKDQSPHGRQVCAQLALRAALNTTGHGDQVTDQQCADGTAVVLKVVDTIRHHTAAAHHAHI